MLWLHLQQPAVSPQGIPQSAAPLVGASLQLQDPNVLRVGGPQHRELAGRGCRITKLQQGHRQIEAGVLGVRLQLQAAAEIDGSLLGLAQIQVARAEIEVVRGELLPTQVGGTAGAQQQRGDGAVQGPAAAAGVHETRHGVRIMHH